MKVRIKVQPSGLLNGVPWPAEGEEIDLPDVVAADLCASGAATPVAAKKAAEKRPAADKGEKRKA
jgi:hypothetical protein